MDKIIENITEPQYVMWIFIAIIVIISKFCIGLNYISVLDIISNHLNCFRNQKGKLDIPKYDCSIDNDSYSRSDG